MLKKILENCSLIMAAAAAIAVLGCSNEAARTSPHDSDSGSDADGDADGDADSDTDTDADGDADTDADGDADGDADTDADGDADGDADADADADTDADGDADGDADADTDADTDADGDADGDADADTDADSDTDSDGDGDADSDTDTDSDSDSDSDSEIGSCSSPEVRITSVDLGSTPDYSTDETYNIPFAIAAKPDGGSLVAWMTGYSHYGSSTESVVHVTELDADDKMVGSPFTFEGHDFQDIAADADGGVLLLTRDGEGSDDQHCGDVDNLCVTPSDRPGCYDMYMVRFDSSGQEQWATQLDTATASAPGYSAGSGWNMFIWWYQHHGRLATDGTNWAAYFCDAITVTNDQCVNGAGKVDIHEGDRMQVVDPSGNLLTGHDSFDLGCSHSWGTSIVWDPRTEHFVMVCTTDNDCRIARYDTDYRTIQTASCDGTLFGGDLINSGNDGYWYAWSYQNAIRIEHFTAGASNQTITTAGNTQNPHLVALGVDNMLLTWGSGSSQAAQIYDVTTGDAVGSQFTIAVPDHPWQYWKSYPDGSAAWAVASQSSSTIQIARVMPCLK